MPLALVDVDASVPIPRESEAEVADALEAALEVVADAVAAHPGPVVALVDVDAVPPVDPQLVTGRTEALEEALLVDALGIASARIRHLLALVLVDALVRILVVDVAPIAAALEAPRRIQATTVSAHCRHQGALVDLFGVIRYRVHYLSRNHAA